MTDRVCVSDKAKLTVPVHPFHQLLDLTVHRHQRNLADIIVLMRLRNDLVLDAVLVTFLFSSDHNRSHRLSSSLFV